MRFIIDVINSLLSRSTSNSDTISNSLRSPSSNISFHSTTLCAFCSSTLYSLLCALTGAARRGLGIQGASDGLSGDDVSWRAEGLRRVGGTALPIRRLPPARALPRARRRGLQALHSDHTGIIGCEEYILRPQLLNFRRAFFIFIRKT